MIEMRLPVRVTALSLAFAVTRTNGSARRLFLGSILYLPMLWGLLVWDHVAR